MDRGTSPPIVRLYLFHLILTILVLPRPVLAESVSEKVAKLHRCYGVFTGKRIPASHPLLLQVKNPSSTLSGTDACLQVFDKATLVSTTDSSDGSLQTPNTEGKAILKQFFEFYNSLEKYDNHNSSNMLEPIHQTYSQHGSDPGEVALYFLRATFDPTLDYSSTVTLGYGLEAIRSLGGSTIGMSDQAGVIPQNARIQLGDLLGVRKVASGISDRASTSVTNALGYKSTTFVTQPIHPHVDNSGALGSLGFITNNNGQENIDFYNNVDFGRMTGTLRNPRRISNQVFRRFLCRELPVIRDTDVLTSHLSTITALGSFRQSSTCMRCHSSMEPLAYLYRNATSDVVEGRDRISDDFGYGGYWSLSMVPVTSTRLPYSMLLTAVDPDFAKRPPDGTLYFRSSVSGTKIDLPLNSNGNNGPGGLGSTLSGLDDYYACSAAQIVEFMTGTHIKLYDPGDAPGGLTPTDIAYRDFVVSTLTPAFKSQKSVRLLIRDILNSSLFYRKLTP